MMQRIDRFLDFLLYERGEAVTINGVPAAAIISDAPRGIDYYFNDKYMRTKIPFATGSVVEYKSETWLVVSQVSEYDPSSYAKLRKCNHLTKFVIDGWLYEFPSFIEMLNLTVNRGGTINLATGKLECTLQANDVTKQLDLDQRFIASDTPWKVVGVDKTKTGLIILNTERDLIRPGDDMENEIADADKLPVWSIGLTDDNREIPLDEEYIFTAVLYRDGNVQSGAVFLWESSDESVVMADGGVLRGVSVGVADITVCWETHPEIECKLTVEVAESPPEVPTYRFYQAEVDGKYKQYDDYELILGDTMLYGVDKFINGVLAPENDSYTFTLNPNGVPAANYVYTIKNGVSVTVQNKKIYTSSPLLLTAVSNVTGISTTIEILLVGFF